MGPFGFGTLGPVGPAPRRLPARVHDVSGASVPSRWLDAEQEVPKSQRSQTLDLWDLRLSQVPLLSMQFALARPACLTRAGRNTKTTSMSKKPTREELEAH